MQCRNCGIEIADKALICYRCGTSTTEAKFKPYVPARRSRRTSTIVILILVLALLVLLAWLLLNSSAGTGTSPATRAGTATFELARALSVEAEPGPLAPMPIRAEASGFRHGRGLDPAVAISTLNLTPWTLS